MAHKKAPRGGDDLDDDFAVEAVTGPAPKAAAAGPAARPAAGSSGKKRKAEASGDALEDGFVAAPALLDNNDEKHKKHKKGGAGASAGAAAPVVIAEEDDEALQAKLAEAKRERRKRQKATNLESGKRRTPDVSTALGVDTAAQAEYWTYWYRATAKDWRSEAELTDRPFGAEFFVDTVAFGQEHKDEAWVSFVKHVYPKWQKNFKSKATPNKGAPVVIVLTSAGQRAADVVRHLGEFNALSKIAKLFAKHLKVEEQVAYLESTVVRLAVGTPNRIAKLVEVGALKLDDLTLVLVDCSKDVKQRSIFDVPEVRADLFHLVEDHCWVPLRTNQLRIALF